jgi:cell wall-associated NlpC family hydrolase
MPTPQEFIDQVRTYIDVPFFHTGRDRNGLDCVGLFIAAAHDLGMFVYDDRNYTRDIDAEYLKRHLLVVCNWIEVGDEKPGDLLLFEVMKNPQHVGVLTANRTMIHTYEWPGGGGKVTETVYDKHWKKRLRGAFRWKDWC